MHLKFITGLMEQNIRQPLTVTILDRAQNLWAYVRLHMPHILANDGQNSLIDQAMDSERYVG
jgi:hypothetical protein